LTGEPSYVLSPLHSILYIAVVDGPGRLLTAGWVTLQEMLLGFAYGVVIGIAIGAAIHLSKVVRQALLGRASRFATWPEAAQDRGEAALG
jgi:ABC-type nitrate/sulfonate/bicarbonate transport system permease component